MNNNPIISVLLTAALLVNSTHAGAEESFIGWLLDFSRTKEVKPVTDKHYQEECGECHFAYQPGLLPARSWDKLLNAEAMRDHFGDNAEMDIDALKAIHDYAVENAADKSFYKRSRKIAAATVDGPAPLRITELKYIQRKHHELPDKMVKGNRSVKSLSYCDKCHTQADDGVYDNDTVSIPNYPDWDD